MINNWEYVDYVGELASNEQMAIEYGKQNVFINNENSIQFVIKILSFLPEDYNGPEIVTGYASTISEGFIDDLSLSVDERIDAFLDYINDYFISFKIETKSSNTYENKVYYNAKNIVLIKKTEQLSKIETFFPTPIFIVNEESIQFDEYLYKMIQGKPIGVHRHISKQAADHPSYVIFEENGELKVVGQFYEASITDNAFMLNKNDEIKIYNFENDDYDYLCKNKNNVAFVSSILDEKIMGKLDSISPISDEYKIDILKKYHTETVEEIDYDLKEKNFIDYLKEYMTSQELLYSEQDIVNFHTSIKSSTIVILAGMSGTGKSRIVKSYADALNLNSNRFKFISVSPGWNDETDLIGYADTLNNVYRPGDSGLINVLKEASENPNKLYIICLDEMNLAKVEHYFSQFLSILEIDEKDKRKLRLYNENLGVRFYNSSYYSSEIKINNNIRFVGTVNIDETVHHFSNKVLDRANVINLEVLPFKQLKEITQKDKNKVKPKLKTEDFDTLFLTHFVKDTTQITLTDREIDFLQQLHNALISANRQIGIGPRVIKQINKYLNNVPAKIESFNRDLSIDKQVVQRILTKIRGSKEEIEELVGIYDNLSKEVKGSKLLDLFEEYEDVSSFEEAKLLIEEKAKDLYINGYAF